MYCGMRNEKFHKAAEYERTFSDTRNAARSRRQLLNSFGRVLFSEMQVFVSVSGQQSGPFTLLNVHEMRRLRCVPAETLAWCQSEPSWVLLDGLLAQHPM